MIRQFHLYLLLLIIPLSVWSQQKDFRGWYTVGVETELFNLVDVSVVPEVRCWENHTRFEGFLTEIDASVPVFKFLRFGIDYRYQADFEDPEQTRQTNRYGVYGQASEKLGGFKFTYRALYHQEFTDLNRSELGNVPLVQHRHKISVRYKNQKLKFSPNVSAEMFFTISPEWSAFEERLRLSAGLQYEISEMLEAEIGYKYQQEYYKNDPLTSHILCVGLTVILK